MTIDANTHLLLDFNGGNGSTNFVDTGVNALSPITVSGDAQQSDAQFKFTGGTSYLSDGSVDQIEVPNHSSFGFLTNHNNPFTIDMWVWFNSVTGNKGFIGQDNGLNHSWGLYFWDGAHRLRFYGRKSFQNQSWSIPFNPSISQWYHIVCARSDTGVRSMAIDGVFDTLVEDVVQTQWSSAINNDLLIGYTNVDSSNSRHNGHLDEARFSDVDRYGGIDFTPETIPYGEEPPPPPPEFFGPDKYVIQTQPIKRRKPITNPGDFTVAGLHVPVPIKMDKWQNLSQPPARRKKVNPANVGNFVFVDFTIPVLPTVLINQWQNTQYPRKPLPPRVIQAAFASSEIAAINPVNGNYFDSGVIGLEVTVVHTAEEQTYADRGVIGLTITGEHTEDFQLEDTGVIGLTIKYPDQGVEAFNSGVPGFVSANVIINGLNESEFLHGVVSVTREDNTAARFSLNLEEDPDADLPRKPIEFINKIITINFAAADMDGVVSDYVPIFVGIIKGVKFNEDQRTLKLSGYDYNGIHQTKGEYISENITDILTGSIGAGSATTLNTGHSPIWGVVWNGSNAVKDGQDYFVDTLNGQIVIPISSRILQYPGHFTYNYANHFTSMKAIIQAIASQKNWIIEEDAVTIADYTNESAHPVLSLSDESVIDTCRKFLELSGAKVEGNLFPQLRVYSEVENWINPVRILTVDEDIIFEETLTYSIDFEDMLNEQTTRSVQRVDADIVIGAGESIAEFTADAPTTNPFTVQTGVTWVWKLDLATPTLLAEHRIAKAGLNSISLSASGRFHMALWPRTFEETITGNSFNYFVDGDDFVIQLSHKVEVINYLNLTLYAYPAFEYTLTVNGSKISYGGGSPEDVRVVTSQRPIGGVSETLKGDVYENPYIETDTHCANINNAVLLEHGNPYTVAFEMPVFEGKDAQIGNRVDIQRNQGTIFSGIIKRLNYKMDLNNGVNSIIVGAKGIGKGI
ncbi:MAG: LamG domain-containing protein [Methylococcaceae bacterium]